MAPLPPSASPLVRRVVCDLQHKQHERFKLTHTLARALAFASSAAALIGARGSLGAAKPGGAGAAPDAVPRTATAAEVPGWAPTRDLAERINDWAFGGETIIHGTPSGLDNTISCFGGAMAYSKPPKAVRRPLPEFPALRIMLTNTKVPKDTCVCARHHCSVSQPPMWSSHC